SLGAARAVDGERAAAVYSREPGGPRGPQSARKSGERGTKRISDACVAWVFIAESAFYTPVRCPCRETAVVAVWVEYARLVPRPYRGPVKGKSQPWGCRAL